MSSIRKLLSTFPIAVLSFLVFTPPAFGQG